MSDDKRVVISQPMLFPWVGMIEQIRLSDVFIFYDDVQFSKGSFVNRVQLKGDRGSEWMTIPLGKFKLGQHINQIVISDRVDWRKKHLDQLTRNYSEAEYADEMLALVADIYSIDSDSLAEITMASMKVICDYFGFSCSTHFSLSSELGFDTTSSERVLDYVLFHSGSTYITGHGAKNYLNHELFDSCGVNVQYMAYQRLPYPQQFGAFDPHVSILDLIANCGKQGEKYICSNTTSWREIETNLSH